MKVVISGILGKMGSAVAYTLLEANSEYVISGIDPAKADTCRFVCVSPDHAEREIAGADVFVCFCNEPTAAIDQSCIAAVRKVPMVIGTTGFSKRQLEELRNIAERTTMVQTYNFSLGIAVLNALVAEAVSALSSLGYDIEIIEEHHGQKLDSPSGTAKMLAETALAHGCMDDEKYVHGRLGKQKREPEEIGIHSVRGGGIFGNHEVVLAGKNEVLRLRHEALSRSAFASGVVLAAEWALRHEPGRCYDMADVLKVG